MFLQTYGKKYLSQTKIRNGCILILARKGSKGILNKNMVNVCSQPLIYYALSEALKTNLDVYVSSDCDNILSYSKKLGASCVKRPEELSQDLSLDIDGFKHFFKKFIKYDYVIHLRATFPLITKEIIVQAQNYFIENYEQYDSMRSMIPAKQNPYKMWHVDDNNATTVIPYNNLHSSPRQAIRKSYIQNACIDIVKRKTVEQKHSMVGTKCLPFLMNACYNIDIDNETDLMEARNAIRIRNGK
jgi:CMP-N-acetylneuraminic acid synthetase